MPQRTRTVRAPAEEPTWVARTWIARALRPLRRPNLRIPLAHQRRAAGPRAGGRHREPGRRAPLRGDVQRHRRSRDRDPCCRAHRRGDRPQLHFRRHGACAALAGAHPRLRRHRPRDATPSTRRASRRPSPSGRPGSSACTSGAGGTGAELEEIADRHRPHPLFDAAHAFGCSTAGSRSADIGRARGVQFPRHQVLQHLRGRGIVTDDDELAGGPG